MNRSFIDNIEAGNNIEAENIFKKEIASIVGDSLELKRKEVSNTFLKQQEREDDV